MPIIIRDDDTSFFTSPAQLEAIYGRLWAQNIPVCLAVIPAQRADVRVMHRPGTPIDPGIAVRYRGQPQEYRVTENRDLCAYLNEQAKMGLVEIVQHGYAHEYMEFLIDDAEVILHKLVEGRHILEEAFPDTPIRTFIAPYDRISPTALRLVFDSGLHLCTAPRNLTEIPPFTTIGPYQAHYRPDGLKLFTCDEYLFNHRDPAEECLAKARQRLQSESMFIVGNHYWCFFYDWNGPNESLFDAWNQFVNDLLAQPDHRITTFADAGI